MTPYSKRGVGEIAKDLILAGVPTKEVVTIVRLMVHGCRITTNSVYFYRSELRREGYAL